MEYRSEKADRMPARKRSEPKSCSYRLRRSIPTLESGDSAQFRTLQLCSNAVGTAPDFSNQLQSPKLRMLVFRASSYRLALGTTSVNNVVDSIPTRAVSLTTMCIQVTDERIVA